MSIQGRIEELSSKHKALEDQIKVQQKQPATDALHLTELKRRKLKIKDELHALSD